ncbi:MAG: addiction module protein [Desulforegulaceae bacterium]|nr:addiction module protein [Desulforegulaceae bacterium]
MDLLQSIHELPVAEKIKVMEFIWEELTFNQKEYVSPDWHRHELEKTAKRMLEGREKVFDWSEAKRLLRKELE